MPTALREHAIEAFAELLRGVTPAAGAQVDLSGCVHVGRAVFGREDGALIVAVLERADQDAQQAAAPAKSDTARRIGNLPLVVQGFCDGPESPYTVSAEVVKAAVAEAIRGARTADCLSDQLAPEVPAGSVSEILVGQPLVRPSEDSRSKAAEFWLQVTLVLAEDRINPFA